jgi:hypothetical protein
LNAGTAAVCFHKDEKVSLATLRLKIYINYGVKIFEQPFIINDGIPFKLTHLDGLRHFTALLTTAAEIGAAGETSVMTE